MMFYKIFSFLGIAIILSACSAKNNVALKGIDLSTSVAGTDTYINMEAIVAMGNLKFPNVEFSIINPVDSTNIGEMGLLSLADGTNQLTISIDYEKASQINPALGTTLPNQREVPVSIVGSSTKLIGIPILQNSRIYLGGDLKSDLYVGAAIAISAFDGVMNEVPIPLNIFFTHPFSADVTGYAGLFTGVQSGQNGVAVFVKKTMTAPSSVTALASAKILSAAASSSSASSGSTVLHPTGGEELSKLSTVSLMKLDRLLQKNATLKIK
jgi:hypothetical protein